MLWSLVDIDAVALVASLTGSTSSCFAAKLLLASGGYVLESLALHFEWICVYRHPVSGLASDVRLFVPSETLSLQYFPSGRSLAADSLLLVHFSTA